MERDGGDMFLAASLDAMAIEGPDDDGKAPLSEQRKVEWAFCSPLSVGKLPWRGRA